MNYIVLWNGKKREFPYYGEALSTAFDYTYQYHRCTSKKADTAIIITRETWSVKLVTFYDVEGTPNWTVTEII